MKKYIFLIFIIPLMTHKNISACPCEFSPHDTRPFFEQYEVKNNLNIEKEKKEEKEENS